MSCKLVIIVPNSARAQSPLFQLEEDKYTKTKSFENVEINIRTTLASCKNPPFLNGKIYHSTRKIKFQKSITGRIKRK